eukprot:COSAG05_NODE_1226_length_5453_cov_6.202279_3_plen_219_part_00
MEGCWHLLRTHDEPLPGLITGTGLEDGLDSQYGFSIINVPAEQPSNPTGLNRVCNANFTVCKKQGIQFQTANTGMLVRLQSSFVMRAHQLYIHFSRARAFIFQRWILYSFAKTQTFMSDYTELSHPGAPIEKLSVYRFFDDEVFAFDDGGRFGWHNGAFGSGGKTAPDGTRTGYGGKCWDSGGRKYGECGSSSGTCPTTVRSYAWYFIWPNTSTATFA